MRVTTMAKKQSFEEWYEEDARRLEALGRRFKERGTVVPVRAEQTNMDDDGADLDELDDEGTDDTDDTDADDEGTEEE